MDRLIEKVTAFITRPTSHGTELLLFGHPHAGVQIPAGTVESDEAPEQAVMREAREESELAALTLCEYLGYTENHFTGNHRLIRVVTRVYARPDPTSLDWAHFRAGIPVSLTGQHAGDFSQVRYEEWDRWPEPRYITYAITGWVSDALLCDTIKRYFYHLEFHGQTEERWSVNTDQHRFNLFWAPLSQLPTIISPQDGWLEFLFKAQGVSHE